LRLAGRGRPAVVVGGGIIAVELAEGLAARGMRVHYFLRGDCFWSSVLDETESRLVERGLAQERIQIHYQTQVARAVGERGSVLAVETKAGEILPCQVLGSAIGVQPQMQLAQRAGLATDRGVLVNEYLETSSADVYAAGDVAQVRDPRTGGTWLETLWPTARAQGQVAGANMAGSRMVCTRGVPFNAVRIGGIVTATIGSVERGPDQDLVTVTANDVERWRQEPAAWVAEYGDDVSRVRILVGERTIVGAVVMGDQDLAGPLLEMIKDEADVTPIRSALQADPARGVELLAAFYRERYVASAAGHGAHPPGRIGAYAAGG
jgi:NAD(P)H-nitrite reductase large subunit